MNQRCDILWIVVKTGFSLRDYEIMSGISHRNANFRSSANVIITSLRHGQ